MRHRISGTFIINKTPMTPDFVKEVHRMLTYGCYDESRWANGERPGEYKKHYYGVGDSAGVLPEDVPEEMEYLCDELCKNAYQTPDDILTAAAFFHCNFESIHPFADGNGRVGRTCMNYFLMCCDIPPVVVFEEDKELYYMSLSVFDKTEKLDGFVMFLKEEMVKTWERPSPGKKTKGKRMICL